MTLRMPGVPYLGPPDSNWSNGEIRPPMGMVVHIAEGSYQGTISWQKNSAADVSSYFVVSQGGDIAQMLDLDLMAWTQVNGNAAWVGVENEGFHTGQFTPAQVSANARIFAFLLQTWPSIPGQVTNSPSVKGLGWHGMGGVAWGNHPDCPGPANVALLPQILAEALYGGAPSPAYKENDMSVKLIAPDAGPYAGGVLKLYPTDLGMAFEPLTGELAAAVALWGPEVHVKDPLVFGRPVQEYRDMWAAMGGGGSALPAHVHVLPDVTGPVEPAA